MSKKRLGLREVRGLAPGTTIWDEAVPGFGARRQESSAVAYVLKYRTTNGRQRWLTIGRHGAPWTPDMAREEAKRVLGQVTQGEDPAKTKSSKRKVSTVSILCDLYIKTAEAGGLLTRKKIPKKLSTLEGDRGRIERHIKPLLGSLPVPAVTSLDIDDFMHAVAAGKTAARIKTTKKRGVARVRGGKGTATRTVGLLGAIFAFALKQGMRPDNPVRGVVRFADGKRDRRFSNDEYKSFGDALEKSKETGIWPPAVAAAHFLALTGWRSGEALGLDWKEVDLPARTVRLGDSKTGRSTRPLSQAAHDVLADITHRKGLVFPATRGDGPIGGKKKKYGKHWKKIAKHGDLPGDLTPHILRHSFSSLAADMGYSESTIAAMVGHANQSVTSRYIHTADAVLIAASDAVAARTNALMAGVVVQLKRVAE